MKEKLIDSYIRKEMNENDRKSFEASLLDDHVLKNEFQLTRDISNYIQETETILLRNQLDDIHAELFERKTVKLIHLPVFRTAAAVLLIAVISVMYLWTNKSVSVSDIMSEYYNPYSSIHKVRSVHLNEPTLDAAFNAYDMGNYEMAVTHFNSLRKENPENLSYKLYAGISNIETENYQTAENIFSELAQYKDSPYAEHAEWYLALTFLKENKVDLATEQFKAIAASNTNYYREKASKIVRKLRKLK